MPHLIKKLAQMLPDERAKIVAAAGAWTVLGLFMARVLAEAPWMPLSFYGWPLTLALAALSTAGLTWLWWARGGARDVAPLLPLYLLVFYLPQPQPNLLQAGVLLGGAAALGVGLSVRRIAPARRASARWIAVLLFVLPLAFYLSTLTPGVGERDGYELQAISATLGYAHPTGYPLFPILGRIWIALFPFGSLAWRINVLCALYAAASIPLLYGTARRILQNQPIAAWSALVFAFSHTLWTQAVQPEKYTLNIFFVSLVLYIAFGTVDPEEKGPHPYLHWLALAYGFSLTHHRTMLMFVPALALYVLWRDPGLLKRPRAWLIALGFALAPLLIYLYIPWRACAQGGCMSVAEFLRYISGAYYSAAIRLTDWVSPERAEMFWRFLRMQFGLVGVGLGLLGLIAMALRRQWRTLTFSALAYAAYYVWGTVWYAYYNDVNSFLPNHLILSLWMGSGLLAIWELGRRFAASIARPVLASLAALLPMALIWANAPLVDLSEAWGLTHWGEYALSQDLAQGATLLADREKHPPLDYFARVEGRRSDLDVVILGDEKAYLDRLVWDLAHDKTVYLARFLPGLDNPYHLRSAGPLIEVGQTPLTALADAPEMAEPEVVFYAPGGQVSIQLLAHTLSGTQEAGTSIYLTLDWRTFAQVGGPYQVNLRLIDVLGAVRWSAAHHPVGDMYPTAAWKAGEIIPDWYEIPLDESLPPGEYRLEVGLFPPFSEAGLIDGAGQAWVALETVSVSGGPTAPKIARPLRVVSANWQIVGYDLPDQSPPAGRASLTLYWQASASLPDLEVGVQVLDPSGQGDWVWEILGSKIYSTSQWPLRQTVVTTHILTMPAVSGHAWVEVAVRDKASGERVRFTPGWLRSKTETLALPAIAVSGWSPVAPGTFNFDDRILLSSVELMQNELTPGGALELTVEWQCLQAMAEDYTLFVQLLAPDGTLKGQIDVWPRDGTHPTSAWRAGEEIADAYAVTLNADAPPGAYRVALGWYLLETMQRLPLLDAEGTPVADHVMLGSVEVK
ncbi:MAG: DUF2723 domain-containing protein [Anaerolineae bacterium]|nr:DUF2723 domain-containing protein [Anaerolineae bacterium]